MQVIGLTGGIATGKSTVSAILKKAGAIVIDADHIAREVVQKGLPAYRDIVGHFGTDILLPDGEIDRNVLADIIFNDPAEKKRLNSIVHPRVTKVVDQHLKQLEKTHSNAIVILDIPLLLEVGMHTDLNEIIVVYAPQKIQIERLMHRDRISKSEALARVRSQMPIEEKKKKATIVIDNSGSIENTRKQTLDIFNRLNDSAA